MVLSKMTECVKVLDNDLLKKYDVKLYGSNHTTYDIINDFLSEHCAGSCSAASS